MIKKTMIMTLNVEVEFLSEGRFYNEENKNYYDISVGYIKSIYRKKDEYINDSIFIDDIKDYLNKSKSQLEEKWDVKIEINDWEIQMEVEDIEIERERIDDYLKRNEIILDIDLKDLEEIFYREHIDSILKERKITIL